MRPEKTTRHIILYAVLGVILSWFAASTVSAHCDTMNGPIIPEARAALDNGDVGPVLKWIQKENETEIRAAFARALRVRTKGDEAREVADQYFLETLIRLHRLGEGASFTGIKDEPVAPIVALADQALVAGSAERMLEDLNHHMGRAVREKFNQAVAARKNKDKSTAAGREFVEAYVTYMHFVEGIQQAISSTPDHHEAAAEEKVREMQAANGHER